MEQLALTYTSRDRGWILTDNQQSIPLPLPCFTRAADSTVDLRVGMLDVPNDILRLLVDLFHGRFLHMNQLGDFLVQPTEFNHILFNFPNRTGSFEGGTLCIVGLPASSTRDLSSNQYHFIWVLVVQVQLTWQLCS